jgi:hypothetical protein
MGNLGEGIDASTSYRSAYIMIGRRSRYAMAFKEYARSSQSRCEPMVGQQEGGIVAWNWAPQDMQDGLYQACWQGHFDEYTARRSGVEALRPGKEARV